MATRISARQVLDRLDSHLQKHGDLYDKLLNKHEVILFGEEGDNGIVFDVKSIVQKLDTLKVIGVGVIIAIIADIVLRFA